MKTFRPIHVTCPRCRTPQDCLTTFTGRRPPQTGDLAACFNCGAINRFVASPPALVRATRQELRAFRRSQPDSARRLEKIADGIREFQHARRGEN